MHFASILKRTQSEGLICSVLRFCFRCLESPGLVVDRKKSRFETHRQMLRLPIRWTGKFDIGEPIHFEALVADSQDDTTELGILWESSIDGRSMTMLPTLVVWSSSTRVF